MYLYPFDPTYLLGSKGTQKPFESPKLLEIFKKKHKVFVLSEQGGFEPPVPCGTTVFKTASLNHSDTAPVLWFKISEDLSLSQYVANCARSGNPEQARPRPSLRLSVHLKPGNFPYQNVYVLTVFAG